MTDQIKALLSEGYSFLKKSEFDSAIKVFKMANNLEPTVDGHSGLASCYLAIANSKHDIELAETQFKAALHIDEQNVPAILNLISLYEMQGRLDDAIEMCKRGLSCSERVGDIYSAYGSILIKLGDLDLAMSMLQKAIVSDGLTVSCMTHFYIGQIEERTGDWFSALRDYKIALDLAPPIFSIPIKEQFYRMTALLN